MKTIVFVFVPISRAEDFNERLADCLTGLPDLTVPIQPPKNKKKCVDDYPFWTWFLPNPLGEPKR